MGDGEGKKKKEGSQRRLPPSSCSNTHAHAHTYFFCFSIFRDCVSLHVVHSLASRAENSSGLVLLCHQFMVSNNTVRALPDGWARGIRNVRAVYASFLACCSLAFRQKRLECSCGRLGEREQQSNLSPPPPPTTLTYVYV